MSRLIGFGTLLFLLQQLITARNEMAEYKKQAEKEKATLLAEKQALGEASEKLRQDSETEKNKEASYCTQKSQKLLRKTLTLW